MAKAECLACFWEAQNNVKLDTSRSKVAWADKIGVSEASIRRHFKHAPTTSARAYTTETSDWEDAASSSSALGVDDFLKNLDIPVEAVTSRRR